MIKSLQYMILPVIDTYNLQHLTQYKIEQATNINHLKQNQTNKRKKKEANMII